MKRVKAQKFKIGEAKNFFQSRSSFEISIYDLLVLDQQTITQRKINKNKSKIVATSIVPLSSIVPTVPLSSVLDSIHVLDSIPVVDSIPIVQPLAQDFSNKENVIDYVEINPEDFEQPSPKQPPLSPLESVKTTQSIQKSKEFVYHPFQPCTFKWASIPYYYPESSYRTCDNIDYFEEYENDFALYMMKEKDYQVTNYFSEKHYSDLNAKMRLILISWLADVHKKFKTLNETFAMTISIFDRFMMQNKTPLLKTKLQLVGVTCFLLACKYEEIYACEIRDIVYICDKAVSRNDVIKMETLILGTLGFNISYFSFYDFGYLPLKKEIFEKYYTKESMIPQTPPNFETQTLLYIFFIFSSLVCFNFDEMKKYSMLTMVETIVKVLKMQIFNDSFENNEENKNVFEMKNFLLKCFCDPNQHEKTFLNHIRRELMDDIKQILKKSV